MIGEHDDLLNVQFSYAEPQHSQLYRDFLIAQSTLTPQKIVFFLMQRF